MAVFVFLLVLKAIFSYHAPLTRKNENFTWVGCHKLTTQAESLAPIDNKSACMILMKPSTSKIVKQDQ